MESRDPFQRLSFESAGNILYYLDPRSVTRCERVSRGWKNFIRAWIISSGFSNSFPGQMKRNTKEDPEGVFRRFKELAAIEANLLSGKPTSVRKLEAHYGLTIAGDFAAWHTSGDIHWQRLSLKDDGSLFRDESLKCKPPLEWCDTILLNSDGYLLIARKSTRIRTQVVSIVLYSLGESRELYTIPKSELDREVTSAPVTLSRTRIYFGSRFSLRVHDLLSGNLLYSVALEDDPGLITTLMSPTPSPRRSFTLLQDDHRELLILLQYQQTTSEVQIMNSDDGSVMQKFQTEPWRSPSVVVAPSQREFAIIGYRNSETLELKIAKFSRGPAGLFHSQCIKVIVLEYLSTSSYLLALDPFRYIVALLVSQSIPAICKLFNSAPRGTEENHNRKRPHNELAVAVNMLHRGPSQKITLPPRYSHHKARRAYVPDPKFYAREMRFIDGDRLLFCTVPYATGPKAYYIFDFGLRIRSREGKVTRNLSSRKEIQEH